ncbi:BTAD domain-containing putative transcriptional regulator [Nocardiopsis sp. NPDC050513]|uniref:AfsR/SARP family transcriptional regulator n=1 Tax=Nocardiopsis sp. NPDC050513 TaxID=3364338 RepID=UPI0037BDD35E
MLTARQGASTTMTVLGELAVFGEDGALDLGAPRQRTVLAALALHVNRPLTTQRIVTTVWGGAAPTYAANLVHKYVSGLRRALSDLPPQRGIRIDNGRSGYRLVAGTEQLDLFLFHTHTEAARGLRDRGEYAGAADLFAEALRLWRGPFLGELPGLAFDDERVYMEGVRLAALEEFATLCIAVGRHSEAIGPLGDALRRHPLEENLARMLMLAHYRAGNTAKAVLVYEELRRRMAGELGVTPQPALNDLVRALRNHAPVPNEPRCGALAPTTP